MNRKEQQADIPLPTDAELRILQVLWRRGPSTVREVMESMQEERKVGYTTVLKLLQIMHEKGHAARDESARSHRYAAAVAEEVTKARLVTDLMDRGFGGSCGGLVIRALAARPPSPSERAEIRRHLEGQ